MSKRKSRKKKSYSFSFLFRAINYLILFVILSALSFAVYNFVFEKNDIETQKIKKDIKTKKIEPKFEELTKELEIEYIDDEYVDEQELISSLKEIEKQEKDKYPLIIKDIKDEKGSIGKKNDKIVKKSVISKKPKLVIIIDDVSNKSEFKALLSIGIKLTLSFFPPDLPYRRDTHKLAKNLKSYMIHLPCEANNMAFDEKKTLHTTDLYSVYDKRIKEIRELFPRARFLNNHTGSVLTADKNSMDRLMKALKKYNFNFIDSKTTNKSVAKIYANKYGLIYFSRNIFIDNKQNINYIINKIKKGIRLAKKRGYAIIIGHPHKATIKALKKAKKYLKEIEVVTIDELSNYIYK